MERFFLSRFGKAVMALALFAGLILAPLPVFAGCGGESFFFIEHWSSRLPCQGDSPALDNLRQNILGIGLWVLDVLLKLAAYVSIGYVIWGGIKYIKAQGDPGELAAAKNTIGQALFGLILCVASFAIVRAIGGLFY